MAKEKPKYVSRARLEEALQWLDGEYMRIREKEGRDFANGVSFAIGYIIGYVIDSKPRSNWFVTRGLMDPNPDNDLSIEEDDREQRDSLEPFA